MDTVEITCPRCHSPATERFYGPCTACRDLLRASFEGLAREVTAEGYAPKMNVVPNQVATKD